MIILIAGASHSGKSILAKKLCGGLGMSYLPLDSIITTLENLYPDTGIQHFDDNLAFSPKLAELIKELTSHLDYEDHDMVLDTYQLFPKDYLKVFPEKNVPVLYLGYPNMSPKEKLSDIRTHQRPEDWTSKTDDRVLIPILAKFIHESKIMADQCQELGLPFYDTGGAFQVAIEEAFAYIKLSSSITCNDPQ